MTPDLDQTLSLKATLQDQISPSLQKIERGVQDTRTALNELVQTAQKIEQNMGSSAEGMANRTGQATKRLQNDLGKTGSAFTELGTTATENSEKIGNALKDALYTRDSSAKLRELDDGLKGLKSSLEGMASTTRPMNTKARRLEAIGQDTLNKKVIPAFQELHGTLDDFPDILQEINTLENQRMSGMQSFGGVLQGVNDRVSGFGEAIRGVQFGVQDFVAGLTSGYTAIQGMQLRNLQITAGRTRGEGAFQLTEDTAAMINLITRAPKGIWENAYTTLLDISKVSTDAYGELIDDMVNLSKATGLATEEFAGLYVQMAEIGQLKGDKWVDLSEKISYFATTSRASIEDLANILKQAAVDMTRFSRESRSAYANASLANAAMSADLGLGAEKAQEIYENILNNPDVASRLQGIVGGAVNVFDAAMRPEMHQELMAQVYEGAARQAERFNARTYMGRYSFNQVFAGTGVDADTALRVQNFMEENNLTGPGQLSAYMRKNYAVPEGKRDEQFDRLVSILRGTAPEQFEQAQSFMEAAGMEIGKHQMKALESFLAPGLDWAQKTALTLYDMNKAAKEHYARFAAYMLLGQNFMTLIRNTLGRLPIIGGILDKAGLNTALGGLVGAIGAAYGIHKVTSGAEEARRQERKSPASMTFEDLRERGHKLAPFEGTAILSENIAGIEKLAEYGKQRGLPEAAKNERLAEQLREIRDTFVELESKRDVEFQQRMRAFEAAKESAATEEERASIQKSAREYVDARIQAHQEFYRRQETSLQAIDDLEKRMKTPPNAIVLENMAKTVWTFAKATFGYQKEKLAADASIAEKVGKVAGEYINFKYGDEFALLKVGAKALANVAVDQIMGPGWWRNFRKAGEVTDKLREDVMAQEAPLSEKQKYLNRLDQVEAGELPLIDPNGAFLNAAALNMGSKSYDETISKASVEQVAILGRIDAWLEQIYKTGTSEGSGLSAKDIFTVKPLRDFWFGDPDADRAKQGRSGP
jgi:hypothetical protein